MENTKETKGLKNLIIPKDKLADFQKGISSLTGIPIFIVDSSGDFLLEPTYSSGACKIIHETKIGSKRCNEEILKLLNDLKHAKTPFFSVCYAGFCRFVLPVIVKGEVLGGVIGCQIGYSEDTILEEESLDKLAAELEIEDKVNLSDTINRANKIPVSQLKRTFESLSGIVNVFFNEEAELSNLTRELVNNYTEINLLYEIGEVFSKGLNLEKACHIILERLLNLMEAERVSLMLLDEQTNELKIAYSKGIPDEIVKATRIKLGEGISGIVAKEGKPMLVENIEDNPEIRNLLVGIKGEFKTHSFLSTPLISSPLKIENKIIGVINVTDKKSGSKFTQHDLNLLSAIAMQIASIIENRRLFSDIRELFITTIRSLSSALDAKDHYTSRHSEEVTECALAIASELNLSDETRADIELAGLLHDIGKIGISEDILLKVEKLSEKEFNEIKKHPARGAEILGHIKQLYNIIPGMLYHHERYDGTGYPTGLKKEEIPLIARILAVADAYNAMTSDRPYRPALSKQSAKEEIKKNAGTQFDPVITEAFLKSFEKGNI